MSNEELIEHLKKECRRVKVQRNEYEQELLSAWRRIKELKADVEELYLLLKTKNLLK